MKRIGGILLSAAILCGMSGCKATYQSGYDDGYNDGYLAGEKVYTAGYYDGYQAGERSYQTGYDEGYAEGYQEGISEKEARVHLKVYGKFTATVRGLIPDYVTDGETARAAVVTLFQGMPFVLYLNENLCKELEIGKTYTFIVEEQEAILSSEEFDDEGNVSLDALILGRFRATDLRTPTEDECEFNYGRVYCTAY